MFSEEQISRITDTSPGSIGGDFVRRYWQPVALSEELGIDPVQVDVLGEELVLFRDDEGRACLIDRYCPHRGTDLSLGWCDRGGLRCIYHGWLIDGAGRCLEQPAEPEKSRFFERVSIAAYPCTERSGLVFAYLGPGEPPVFPDYDFLRWPDAQVYVTKVLHECNFLQGNEGNLDQAHLGFLHRFPNEGLGHETIEATAPGSAASPVELTAEDVAPRIQVFRTDFGFRELTTRRAPEGVYLKVQSFVLPNLALFPGAVQGVDGYQVHWHVPIDNVSHWKYVLVFQRTRPVDKAGMARMLVGESELLDGFRPVRNRRNGFLQDRAAMRTDGTVGLGIAFEIQDQVVIEAQGAIQDRSREHLGYSDRSIIALRRTMLDAIDTMLEGSDPPHVARSVAEAKMDHLVVVAEVVPDDVDPEVLVESRATTGAVAAQ